MQRVEHIKLNSLEVEIFADEEHANYVFQGAIDEQFVFKQIPILTRLEVTFTLRNVTSFNSCGTREWIFFMRSFPPTSTLLIAECSVVMFDQFNIVPQLFAHAQMLSFYAPYFCRHCDEEVNCLIQVEPNLNLLVSKQAPHFKHTCGTDMEFDALEESYFRNFRATSSAKRRP